MPIDCIVQPILPVADTGKPKRRRGPRKKRSGRELERAAQRMVVEWLRLCGHTPMRVGNEQLCGPQFLGMAKADGLQEGAPDLIMAERANDGRPVAIEMKRADGGVLSGDQVAVHERMTRNGWHVLAPAGFDEAKAQLQALGFGERLRPRLQSVKL